MANNKEAAQRYKDNAVIKTLDNIGKVMGKRKLPDSKGRMYDAYGSNIVDFLDTIGIVDAYPGK